MAWEGGVARWEAWEGDVAKCPQGWGLRHLAGPPVCLPISLLINRPALFLASYSTYQVNPLGPPGGGVWLLLTSRGQWVGSAEEECAG